MEKPPVGVEGESQAETETLDHDKLFEFYLAVQSEQLQWMNRHEQHFRHYLMLVTAILAATLGAVYQFRSNVLFTLAAATLGFVVNILLCCFAVLACNRSYQRFLEAVTIAAKLEGFFGLDGPRPSPAHREGSSPRFPKDARLLPERWLESRRQETAAQFVKENMGRGLNLVARITMVILAAMNAGLLVGVILWARSWG